MTGAMVVELVLELLVARPFRCERVQHREHLVGDPG